MATKSCDAGRISTGSPDIVFQHRNCPERHQNYTMLVQQIKSGVARSLILASGLELAKKKKKKNEFAVEHAHRAQDEESQILQYKQRTPN